jgi:serine O-acetyltransferase
MILSMPIEDLVMYVRRQIEIMFSDNYSIDINIIRIATEKSIARLNFCFSKIISHYYSKNDTVYFNHLNSDHYAAFLYCLSNEVWRYNEDDNLATKIFLLNKMMHGLDVLYSVILPDIFQFIHPIGTVLGKAQYSNHFVVYQGCTVGADNNKHPELGDGLVMFSNSKILGECKTGNNVILGANTVIINKNVEEGIVVVGAYPNNKFHVDGNDTLKNYFRN